jgi:hypothetical protein
VSDDTYLTALKMLARRELSEAQIRQRLARRQHDEDAIERPSPGSKPIAAWTMNAWRGQSRARKPT